MTLPNRCRPFIATSCLLTAVAACSDSEDDAAGAVVAPAATQPAVPTPTDPSIGMTAPTEAAPTPEVPVTPPGGPAMGGAPAEPDSAAGGVGVEMGAGGSDPSGAGGSAPTGMGGAGVGGASMGAGGAESTGGGGAGEMPESASPGCLAIDPNHIGERTLEGEMDFEGGSQPYRVLLPSTYGEETKAWPLVFALHPNGQTMGLNFWNDIDGDTNNEVNPGIIDSADGRAIVLTPASIDGFWRNDGDREPHLSMMDNLYDYAINNLCIDTDRVYSIGHSGGAGFSAHLGCEREYVKGFACNGGISYFGTDEAVENNDCVHSPEAWFGWGQDENGGVSLFDAYRAMHGCQDASPNFDDDPPCVDLECDTGRMRFCRPPGGHGWPGFVTGDVLDFLLQE